MTPQEIQQLREYFTDLLKDVRRFATAMASRSPLELPQVPADATPHDLIRLLNRVEVATANMISQYLQRSINFEQSLADQHDILYRVLMLDRNLSDLHHLFDPHIEWIINHELDNRIRTAMQNLLLHVRINEQEELNNENRRLLPIVRQRLLVHCYRAMCFGLRQNQLVSLLSERLTPQRELELKMRRSQAVAGLMVGPTDEENSWAREEGNGNPPVARSAALNELNQILEDVLCETKITEAQYAILNGLYQNQGSGSEMEFVLPLTTQENMQFIPNRANYHLDRNYLEIAMRRMFSGVIFIKRDEQIGYSSFHILIMHELIHALHIAQGLSASQINEVVSQAKWGGSDVNELAGATEEFKTTVFDDISEYSIGQEMGIQVHRLPYIVFILSLGKMRAYWNNQEVASEIRQPLRRYMIENQFLPPEGPQSSCCNLM